MPTLTIVCGLPGVGKTTLARKIAEKTGQIILRTDVIRKEIKVVGYSEKEKQKVYAAMLLRAGNLLKEGKGVILDATFNKAKNRRSARKLAGRLGASFEIIEVICSEEIVKERLEKRTGDESEAQFEHYLKQKKFFEPIDEEHIAVDSSGGL